MTEEALVKLGKKFYHDRLKELLTELLAADKDLVIESFYNHLNKKLEVLTTISESDLEYHDFDSSSLFPYTNILWYAEYQQEKEKLMTKQLDYDNFFYYDLIELNNGLHIPVTMIKPFWRNYFERTKPTKTRDHSFFSCPICDHKSFYSPFQSGCTNCGFQKFDYYFETEKTQTFKEHYLIQKYRQKQLLKQKWLKRGTWVFRVRAYVSSTITRSHTPKTKVLEYWRQ